MTDLDTRIRSYASEWSTQQEEPPSFDAALARAAEAPRRRLTPVWSGLAAACVVALAVVVAVAAGPGRSGSGSRAGESGSPSSSVSGIGSPSVSAEESLQQSLAASAASAARDEAERADLKQIALREAVSAGDPNASAQAVRTTRQNALVASGGGSGGPDNPVWLIQLTGHLTVYLTGPKGSPPTMTGRYLTLVVPVSSGADGGDYGLSNKRTDLEKLGTVVTLLP